MKTVSRHATALTGYAMLLGGLLALAGCHAVQLRSTAVTAPWSGSRQMVLVIVDDWNADHGVLRRFARAADGAWQAMAPPQTVAIGKAGAAWGVGLDVAPVAAGDPIKREGDHRSPAGMFRIGSAFGYMPRSATALPYRALTASDWCVDVSGAAQYNRIVDAAVAGADAVRGSSEPMRRDLHANGDMRYQLGFVIEHNAAARPGAGSCIFAHVWRGRGDTTAGCTSMPLATMQALLAWLQPSARPLFVLLPRAQYQRLRAAWQLPVVGDLP